MRQSDTSKSGVKKVNLTKAKETIANAGKSRAAKDAAAKKAAGERMAKANAKTVRTGKVARGSAYKKVSEAYKSAPRVPAVKGGRGGVRLSATRLK